MKEPRRLPGWTAGAAWSGLRWGQGGLFVAPGVAQKFDFFSSCWFFRLISPEDNAKTFSCVPHMGDACRWIVFLLF